MTRYVRTPLTAQQAKAENPTNPTYAPAPKAVTPTPPATRRQTEPDAFIPGWKTNHKGLKVFAGFMALAVIGGIGSGIEENANNSRYMDNPQVAAAEVVAQPAYVAPVSVANYIVDGMEYDGNTGALIGEVTPPAPPTKFEGSFNYDNTLIDWDRNGNKFYTTANTTGTATFDSDTGKVKFYDELSSGSYAGHRDYSSCDLKGNFIDQKGRSISGYTCNVRTDANGRPASATINFLGDNYDSAYTAGRVSFSF